jgi:hypothetical protein
LARLRQPCDRLRQGHGEELAVTAINPIETTLIQHLRAALEFALEYSEAA